MPADPSTVTYLLLALSAAVAGGVNAVAGGGTLLTFPALAFVLTQAQANATSTVALLPGSLAGAWGYRAELAATRQYLRQLLPPSLAGGIVGASLVVAYPGQFEKLVPWLILTAAVLFLAQPLISRLLKRRVAEHAAPGRWDRFGAVAFQFLVAVYGGYFGAGIGILMLSALGLMGVGDMHKMNAIKTVLAGAINAVSVVIFVADGLVDWRFAGVMAVAAIAGGYGAARVARRLPPTIIRWGVIAIGFGLAAWYFLKVGGG